MVGFYYSLTHFHGQANLEKQLKELNLRIVDLETKSYSRNPQTSSAATIRRLESQIEELTNQLNQATKERRRASLPRDRDVSAQLVESNRQKVKLEEEVRLYDEKVKSMRHQMDAMVSTLAEYFTGFQRTNVDFISANDRERIATREAPRRA